MSGVNMRAALTATAPVDHRVLGGGRYTDVETSAHVRAAADQLVGSLGLSGTMRWCREQGWGTHHTKSVVQKAQSLIAAENAETIDQSRARMTAWLEHEIRDAENAVMVTKNGERCIVKDRRAIAAYAHLLVTLRGLNVSTVQHVGAGARPLRDLSTAELIQQEQQLAQAIADRSTDATVLDVRSEDLTGVGDPIPSQENDVVTLPDWVNDARRAGGSWLARARNFGSPDGTSSPCMDG